MQFTRITLDPQQMGGMPCIRGMRIPVATVVGMVADGMDVEEILHAFPDLEADDIRQALQYAAEALRERTLPAVTAPRSFWWTMPYHLWWRRDCGKPGMMQDMSVTMACRQQRTKPFLPALCVKHAC